MIIKRALSTLRSKLSSPTPLTSKMLVPLILLSSLKDYLFSSNSSTPSEPFPISDELIQKTSTRSSKMVLVLDMDETLIYSRSEDTPTHPDYFEVNSKKESFYVERRPYLTEFLEAASKVFIIYVYTAGKKQYADSILNVIDPKGVIEKRFYRESCVKKDGSYVKDLGKIKGMRGVEIGRGMVLLDDNQESVGMNAPNSVFAKPYEGGSSDRELPKLFRELLRFYD